MTVMGVYSTEEQAKTEAEYHIKNYYLQNEEYELSL